MSADYNGKLTCHGNLERIQELAEETHTVMIQKMDSLISATKEVGNKVESLESRVGVISSQNNTVVKYLLWVVCIIALGTKLLELAKGFAPNP